MGWLGRLRGEGVRGTPGLEPMMQTLAARDDAKTRRQFYEALLRANLIVPSPGLEATGLAMGAAVTLERAQRIHVMGTEAPDGSRGMIALTSEAALLAWRNAGCPYVEMAAREAFALALGSGFGSVVLNPRGPAGGFLRKGELAALAEGSVPGGPVERLALAKGTSIALGAPAQPAPAKLLAVVRAQAEARPEVKAAWLLQLAVGEDAPHLCVVLEHEPAANPETFVPPLMAAIQATLPEGECVDCLPQPTGASILATARAAAPPLFVRG
jgi:hypothetical protein